MYAEVSWQWNAVQGRVPGVSGVMQCLAEAGHGPASWGSVVLNGRREDGDDWVGAVLLPPVQVGVLCKSVSEVYVPVCTLKGLLSGPRRCK